MVNEFHCQSLISTLTCSRPLLTNDRKRGGRRLAPLLLTAIFNTAVGVPEVKPGSVITKDKLARICGMLVTDLIVRFAQGFVFPIGDDKFRSHVWRKIWQRGWCFCLQFVVSCFHIVLREQLSPLHLSNEQGSKQVRAKCRS